MIRIEKNIRSILNSSLNQKCYKPKINPIIDLVIEYKFLALFLSRTN